MRLDMFVELLAQVPLFETLSNEQLTRFVNASAKVAFSTDQTIIMKDHSGDKAFLIVDGYAQRVNGPGLGNKPEVLGPGTFIGEMAMLVETDYGSTIVCCSDVKALCFTHAMVQEIMEEDPVIAEIFADHMRERFLMFTSQLQELNDIFDEKEQDKQADEEDQSDHPALMTPIAQPRKSDHIVTMGSNQNLQ